MERLPGSRFENTPVRKTISVPDGRRGPRLSGHPVELEACSSLRIKPPDRKEIGRDQASTSYDEGNFGKSYDMHPREGVGPTQGSKENSVEHGCSNRLQIRDSARLT